MPSTIASVTPIRLYAARRALRDPPQHGLHDIEAGLALAQLHQQLLHIAVRRWSGYRVVFFGSHGITTSSSAAYTWRKCSFARVKRLRIASELPPSVAAASG